MMLQMPQLMPPLMPQLMRQRPGSAWLFTPSSQRVQRNNSLPIYRNKSSANSDVSARPAAIHFSRRQQIDEFIKEKIK
jgi:hypothetical protein